MSTGYRMRTTKRLVEVGGNRRFTEDDASETAGIASISNRSVL
jgi:hypothetical protein